MSIREMGTRLVKKIALGSRYSSETYIAYLKTLGVKIGDDVTIYRPSRTLIDVQYPWMITIGNHVRITEGVKILTHDYAWSVLKELSDITGGAILGASGCVEIGNNVFIGMDSIILRNVKIGNNVIIGVGSIVTKDCEDNSVYVGAPAKKIMSIQEYYDKRVQIQAEEAKKLAKCYYKRYGKRPEPEIFHEYFLLFSNEKTVVKNKVFAEKIKLGDNETDTINFLKNNTPQFSNYEEFMKYCFEK